MCEWGGASVSQGPFASSSPDVQGEGSAGRWNPACRGGDEGWSGSSGGGGGGKVCVKNVCIIFNGDR